MAENTEIAYAGDIDPASAYRKLADDPAAQLVDVRTRPEWSFVGVPDLGGLGKEPILLEWQTYPGMQVAADFLDRLRAELAARGAPADAPLFFLCRSGVRSLAAATAATASGFGQSFNVSGGFEGPGDADRHRGRVAGWKASDLPWVQS